MWDLLISSASETDIAETALWYENQKKGLGLEFIAEIEAAFGTLQKDPERFRIYYPARQIRRILTDRFPCHVYYHLEGRVVRVFAIVHASRHEHEWKGRL